MKDKIDLDCENDGEGPCGQNSFIDATNYAECVPFRGPESLLVLGGTITGSEFVWEDFLVVGSEKFSKKSKLVMDLDVDEETYQLFVKNFGTGSMLFSRAGGQGRITRSGWKSLYGTDALRGMIMKTLNRDITGGGVHIKK